MASLEEAAEKASDVELFLSPPLAATRGPALCLLS